MNRWLAREAVSKGTAGRRKDVEEKTLTKKKRKRT